eukprot:7384242-Prymnesium_polylepis.1
MSRLPSPPDGDAGRDWAPCRCRCWPFFVGPVNISLPCEPCPTPTYSYATSITSITGTRVILRGCTGTYGERPRAERTRAEPEGSLREYIVQHDIQIRQNAM